MQKHLYFICPTDCLEPIINRTFGHHNYYYTSLGNSVIFDDHTVKQAKRLIVKNNIREIFFVLSHDNRIVWDALGNQGFAEIRGLSDFYHEIIRQKERSEWAWRTFNHPFIILSYYLNQKIKELQHELDRVLTTRINIKGKIYHQQERMFNDIYSELICQEHFHLN